MNKKKSVPSRTTDCKRCDGAADWATLKLKNSVEEKTTKSYNNAMYKNATAADKLLGYKAQTWILCQNWDEGIAVVRR
jgi:hypothetical protein